MGESETVGKEGSMHWTGPRPLFFAGLYSIWYSDEDRQDRKKPIFNYTVITRDSNDTLNWLHDRMPAILSDSDAVSSWLDPQLHGFDALKVLRPVETNEIGWYPISKEVGNVRNKDPRLCAPVKLEERTGKALNKSDQKSKQFMANWLGTPKRKSDLGEGPSNKNAKKEHTSSTPSAEMDIVKTEGIMANWLGTKKRKSDLEEGSSNENVKEDLTTSKSSAEVNVIKKEEITDQDFDIPPVERFKTQLDTLKSMGFTDKQANSEALMATDGDVNAAIDQLLNS